jgi:hypothetical protein
MIPSRGLDRKTTGLADSMLFVSPVPVIAELSHRAAGGKKLLREQRPFRKIDVKLN